MEKDDFSNYTRYTNEAVCELIVYQLNKLIHCEGALYDHSKVVTPDDIRDVCRRYSYSHGHSHNLIIFASRANSDTTTRKWLAETTTNIWRLIRDDTSSAYLGKRRTFSVKVSSDMGQWGESFSLDFKAVAEGAMDLLKTFVFKYARHIDVLVTADVDIKPRYDFYKRYKIFPSCNIYGSGVFEGRMVHSYTIRDLDDHHTSICVGAEPINLG